MSEIVERSALQKELLSSAFLAEPGRPLWIISINDEYGYWGNIEIRTAEEFEEVVSALLEAGTKFGRKPKLNATQQRRARELMRQGGSVRSVADEMNVHYSTISRLRG